MKNKKAFTLTELLVALGIIGAIAAMAIPSLLNSINNRIHAAQMRSFTQSMQQLINNQLIKNKTKNLLETDFASTGTLLTDSNFDIADTCSDNDCFAEEYRSISNSSADSSADSSATVRLKSGVVISFIVSEDALDEDTIIWRADVDVNGSDAPNIIGRDFFSFYITKKGKIWTDDGLVLNTLITNCKSGDAADCYAALVENNWVMPY